MQLVKPSLSWLHLYLITFLASYIYIFNEWLFAVTKPSFINGLSTIQQLQIFLITSALLASICFLVLLPPVVSSYLPFLRNYKDQIIKLSGILPAIIVTALILIMVDNFTYTVFKWGIVLTAGWNRIVYAFGFLVVLFSSYRSILNWIVCLSQHNRVGGIQPKWLLSILTSIILLSIILLLFPGQTSSSPFPNTTTTATTTNRNIKQTPHILFITSDGVDASHTSLYGYHRDTTPNLRRLAESALVAENAFSNTAHTGGSVTSIYTSKYPTNTRVFWIPNRLEGIDAYEHLPGILRSQGYRTVQITVPLWLDPIKLNLLNAFDEVKFSNVVHSKYLNHISKVLPRDKALFTDELIKRLIDRIRHIFFIINMESPYLSVTKMPAQQIDMERWEYLKHEIHTTKQPLFAHIHLMGTHGKTFNPVEQKFSVGQDIATQPYWNDDFYDDSILEFDKHVGELVEYLQDLELLDSTVLIIGSDHGQRTDKQLKRIPLILRFPNGEYTGKINVNIQNLDISPTILDYLGINPPDWMQGNSLINDNLAQRPIFGISEIDPVDWDIDHGTSKVSEKPPESFDIYIFTTLIYCTKWYSLNLYTLSWESGTVDETTTVCQPNEEITDKHAFQWISTHLFENGFDTSQMDYLSP